MFVLAIVLGVFQWAQQQKGDFDLAPSDTADYIAAVQFKDNGQQAVVFAPDAKMTASSGWQEGLTDRDLAWQPDGNRLFFVSDREARGTNGVKAFNIFRWDPVRNSEPAQRTVGTRGRSNIHFPAEQAVEENRNALITSGGFVLEFDSKEGSTRQVLPPVGREVVRTDEEGSGVDGQFSQLYKMLGGGADSQISFRVAKWCGGKDFIAAVLRGEEGETFLVQDMRVDVKGQAIPPKPIMAGERVEISVDPKTGNVVFCVLGFRWISPELTPPQFKLGNKLTTPFRHGIGFVDPREGVFKMIAVSVDDAAAFASPEVSPDGSRVATVVGTYEDGAVTPLNLALMPVAEQGVKARTELLSGEVYEPNWHPSGDRIAFIRRKDGRRVICVVGADGSGERQVSGEGEFAFPKFSPQIKSK
jgi:TolB protein